ncbi:hypothetical protein bas03_0004 [Escherichia phage JulesPiccard]|uniref:Uncharacterized protein n=1 Tax=Escherichia phage JulesPiccard TaxID=2851956 RepID=A0AAE7VWN0_9CAUD|nr:hypothetical protein bas03_0004 [Escherichia phage JulesPiccard]
MTNTSKAVYIGNNDDKYCGFTPGNEYDVCVLDDGFLGVYDDDDIHRCIKNGTLHEFKLDCEDGHFVTETECEVMPPIDNKKPELRYYINGHEVDMVEFGNVRYTVEQLNEDGVKCDTIKFEVKFE